MNSTNSFAQGVLFGSVLGAGLVLLLAPRAAAEARRTLTDSANSLRDATTDQYGQARRRVVAAVDEVVAKGEGIRNDVANAIGNGAREAGTRRGHREDRSADARAVAERRGGASPYEQLNVRSCSDGCGPSPE